MEKRSGRLLSLDALRGFDMFFIMGARLCMLLAAVLLLAVGYIGGLVFPINKNLWTSSFVCCAAG